jgi:hypothetical protein
MDVMARGSMALQALLLTAAVFLAGCSGSISTGSSGSTGDSGAIDRQPPTGPGSGDAQAGAEPSVTLSASDSVVGSGQSTTLTWRGEHVTSCTASGGWSGTRAVSGSVSVGPIDQSTTFTLTCSGDAGSVVAMISVGVIGVVTLSWQAPTENVDGSPLADLSGYRIYVGTTSRQYTDEVPVNDPARTSQSLQLASGDYYIAMTAIDGQGNESGYSNEIVRSVN